VAQQGQQAAQQAAGGQQQPNATQAAKQKAQELGVDLNQVQGTGAEGRITVRDVTST
jgi:pyruvate/2-oxoglutarate dehydrogenase complex dihydrolipoamide acyltransferase (E2) component